MEKVIKPRKKQKKAWPFLLIGVILLGYFNLNPLLTQIQRIESRIMISRLKSYEQAQAHGLRSYYKTEDQPYIQEIMETSQKMIEYVNENMKQEVVIPFNMVIYPNSMEMNKGLRLPSGEETLGAYYGGNVFLLSPSQVNLEDNTIENIILHEYTHLLVEERTKGNHPIWFTEGMALYQEYKITGYEWGEGYHFAMDIPLYLDQLEKRFNQVNTFAAYRASFLRIQYLYECYGEEALLEIMAKMGENKSYDQAVQNILGKNKNQLENEFMLWYQDRFYDKL